MRIVFRCDSSADIGLGHVVRCLAVAKELRGENNIIFATSKDNTNSYIKDKNFEIFFKEREEPEEVFLDRLNSILKPDVIVIDKKYPYSARCLNDLKQDKTKIVMLDNVCEGLSTSDVVIFPAAHLDPKLLEKYLPQDQLAHVKTGPEYIILRDEILESKNLSFKKKFLALPKKYYTLYPIKNVHASPTLPNIVVTTGGTDPEGVLFKLIPWLNEMNLEVNILILVGQAFKFKDELERLIGNLPDNFRVMPYSLQELIKGDIVICSFGVSIYEMIYLQIPTICIAHSVENAYGARILKDRYGVIEDMGYIKIIDPRNLHMSITKLLTDKAYYQDMIERCDSLIDGEGAKRVARMIV
jgi:spore coat polysaccharide biosynthesis predicted glycosyltransferase SpsG